jgi:hypothetical protein
MAAPPSGRLDGETQRRTPQRYVELITRSALDARPSRAWFWKSCRWFISASLISPLAALVLGIGVKISQGGCRHRRQERGRGRHGTGELDADPDRGGVPAGRVPDAGSNRARLMVPGSPGDQSRQPAEPGFGPPRWPVCLWKVDGNGRMSVNVNQG